MTTTITIETAVAELRKAGYDADQIDKLVAFHNNDRRILIFRNEDLGHPALGHIFAMPYDGDDIPDHGPDTAATGLGWRYLTAFVIEPTPSPVQEV